MNTHESQIAVVLKFHWLYLKEPCMFNNVLKITKTFLKFR